MNINDLKPANDYAINYGIKAIVYGPAGSSKTPLINTCPRPVLLACEPGLLSMRGSKVPTWIGATGKAIDDFFDWFFSSNEVKNFDTLAVDSTSQMAEIYLEEAQNGTSKSGNKLHGLAAYGQANRNTMKHLEALYFFRNKHAYLISKQEIINQNGLTVKRPYHPGRELPIKIPHRFDQVLQLDIHNVPGMGQVKAFRCQSTIDTIARDRTGKLAEFEPPDFGLLVKKAMS